MRSEFSRRDFLIAGGGALAACGSLTGIPLARAAGPDATRLPDSPFKVSVIDDEISQDFGHCCEVATKQFGMGWIEVRGMWNKNVVNLEPKEIAEAQRLLRKYDLRVSDVASPLFKTDWPGAPKSTFSPAHDQFGANFSYAQQDEVLDRSIELAKKFSCERIRCFD